MTLNEIAYNLLNLMRAGRTHNDENISIAQIKFNIKWGPLGTIWEPLGTIWGPSGK